MRLHVRSLLSQVMRVKTQVRSAADAAAAASDGLMAIAETISLFVSEICRNLKRLEANSITMQRNTPTKNA